MVGRAILLLTYNCPSPNTMSSRHGCATEEYRTKCKKKLEEVAEKKHRKKVWKCVVKAIAGKSATKVGREFRIVVNTIAGKSYEITKAGAEDALLHAGPSAP